jgi:hypothetical protein
MVDSQKIVCDVLWKWLEVKLSLGRQMRNAFATFDGDLGARMASIQSL